MEGDRRVLLAAMKLARRLLKSKPLAPYYDFEEYPGEKVQTDAELLEVARERGTTTFHPNGTCRMAPKTDPLAVVDDQLRVHGLEGLRVIDASIMPTMLGESQRRHHDAGRQGLRPHPRPRRAGADCAGFEVRWASAVLRQLIDLAAQRRIRSAIAPYFLGSSAGSSAAAASATKPCAWRTQSSFSMRPPRETQLVHVGDIVVGEVGDLVELDDADAIELARQLRRHALDAGQIVGLALRPLKPLKAALRRLARASVRSKMRATCRAGRAGN